ncbi:MAG: hypothetical protein Q4B17_05625 [Lautropia sp.]|nr:hypothetical protein [Lautropia sp.]
MDAYREKGQAMTETLVLAVAVLPFVLAVPLIAKYQDIRHATVSASRTAAFECSIRPDACADGEASAGIEAHVRRRHFSQRQIAIHSNDTPSGQSLSVDGNRFWRSRDGRPLIASDEDVTVSISQRQATALSSAHREAANKHGQPRRRGRDGARASGDADQMLPRHDSRLSDLASAMSKAVGPDAFGMPLFGGLVTAEVQSRALFDPKLVEGLDWDRPRDRPLSFASRTVVLTDSWNASSARGHEASSLKSRVDQGKRLPSLQRFASLGEELIGMAPPGAITRSAVTDPEAILSMVYAPTVFLIHTLARLPGNIVVPHGQNFRRLEVDVEVVPEDRLKKP